MPNFSSLIDIAELLKDCDVEYCVVKKPEHFPKYVSYSDVDIVCADRYRMSSFILGKLNPRRGKDISIKVNKSEEKGFTHLDIYIPGANRLDLKLDLVDDLNKVYNKTSVKKSLTAELLKNRISVGGIYFLQTKFEMVVRMLEYREYISTRPEKIKHLKYVEENTDLMDEFKEVWCEYIQEE